LSYTRTGQGAERALFTGNQAFADGPFARQLAGTTQGFGFLPGAFF